MTTRVAAAIFFCLMVATSASAQTSQKAFAGVVVSATTIEDGVSPSITGGIGYQLNSTIGLGFELTFVPQLRPEVPDDPDDRYVQPVFGSIVGFPYPSPIVTFEPDDGHAMIFTANVRLTVPTRSRRFSPYLVGGAGVGTVRDTIEFRVTYPPILLPAFERTVLFPEPAPFRESFSVVTTGFAATLGGGLSILTSDHWSVDADARYVAIFGSRDLQIGRYGAGITYRF
jgi:opacity protein-like surface antigen